MRVCPECGHKESPIWKNRFHRLYEQYCRLDELETWEPELAKELTESAHVLKEKYVYKDGVKYRINEDDMVLRIDAFLCANPDPTNRSIVEPNKEKHKARVIGRKRFQSRLLEVGV